jgi:hypothetical protein
VHEEPAGGTFSPDMIGYRVRIGKVRIRNPIPRPGVGIIGKYGGVLDWHENIFEERGQGDASFKIFNCQLMLLVSSPPPNVAQFCR